MKKIIALVTALIMVLSLSACFGSTSGTSTADEANAADVSAYDKTFEGLQKYITDRNGSASKSEIYYEIVGAKDGVRYVLNNNAYVEIYDFTDADSDTAKAILADIRDDGTFQPVPDGTGMTAVITDSGSYVLAWDATRSYDYANKVATDELKANW